MACTCSSTACWPTPTHSAIPNSSTSQLTLANAHTGLNKPEPTTAQDHPVLLHHAPRSQQTVLLGLRQEQQTSVLSQLELSKHALNPAQPPSVCSRRASLSQLPCSCSGSLRRAVRPFVASVVLPAGELRCRHFVQVVVRCACEECGFLRSISQCMALTASNALLHPYVVVNLDRNQSTCVT